MHYLGLDGHDFIYDLLNDFTIKFDWVICNNTIIKSDKHGTETPRTICMKTDFLPKYVDLLSSVGRETGGDFVLLTCSSMYSPAYHYPDETRRILENPHLIAWFSENNTMAEGSINPHPKMRHFPSGLNYHNTELQRKCDNALLQIYTEGAAAYIPQRDFLYCPPFDRELFNDAYCKTFCGLTRNLIRGEPFTRSSDIYIYYIGLNNPTAPTYTKYTEYYQTLKNYKFLICPHEATIDPFPRIWEALALGVIPVMIYNPLSENLYKGLPIWFIDNWAQIYNRDTTDSTFLEKKYCELMMKSPNYSHQLTADYWFDCIFSAYSRAAPHFATSSILLQCCASPQKYSSIAWRMKIIFSFCIYGSNMMYYDGLNENIRIIFSVFGDNASIYIYAGKSAILSKIIDFTTSSTPQNFEKRNNGNIKIIETGHDGVINMIYRYSGVELCGCGDAADADDTTEPIFYFVRDSDSIIGDRDLWCIFDFISETEKNENISAHIIRDHYHHKSKMTGGLCGFSRLGIKLVTKMFHEKIASFQQGDYSVYGNDEEFLNKYIYPLLFEGGAPAATAPLVHSNFCVLSRDEKHKPILCCNTLTNFCGNVRQIDPFMHFQFIYSDFDVNAQWKWTVEHSAYELFIQTILSLKRTYKIFTAEELDPRENRELSKRLYAGLVELPYSSRSRTVAYLIEAYLRINYIEGCYASYQLYAYCEIHERAKELMWDIILSASENNTILFMTSGCENEYFKEKPSLSSPQPPIIIVYGAYADDWNAYVSKFFGVEDVEKSKFCGAACGVEDVAESKFCGAASEDAAKCSNVIHRNIWYYEKDRMECKKRGISYEWIECSVWSPVKQVYIMGVDVAPDRIYETKQELSRVGISLEKIQTYLAKKDADKSGAYLGATKNHADVLALSMAKIWSQNDDNGVILFLEDDFVFSGNPTERLMEFWRRCSIGTYDYDICLLSASKMHERAELDDLISYSRQYCTTSSAYFVPARKNTLEKVAALVREGYEKMKETGDTVTYCIDRYWTKIQPANRMILFKEKLGFQRPSMSKITGSLNAMLD